MRVRFLERPDRNGFGSALRCAPAQGLGKNCRLSAGAGRRSAGRRARSRRIGTRRFCACRRRRDAGSIDRSGTGYARLIRINRERVPVLIQDDYVALDQQGTIGANTDDDWHANGLLEESVQRAATTRSIGLPAECSERAARAQLALARSKPETAQGLAGAAAEPPDCFGTTRRRIRRTCPRDLAWAIR